ncbi:hypothetical protein IQ243_19455 [Nostocales cyanobacterium LEGE 11386]|nr:hypothetical protein [Nostocales cyanobacterium LEGE 11386]
MTKSLDGSYFTGENPKPYCLSFTVRVLSNSDLLVTPGNLINQADALWLSKNQVSQIFSEIIRNLRSPECR